MTKHEKQVAAKVVFQKLFISLRYFLLGLMQSKPEYKVALDALEYAALLHTNLRKDGFTPEFQHQLEITHLLRTLIPWLRYPAETLAAAILHDTMEDTDVHREDLEQRFGELVTNASLLLNKYDEQGHLKDEAAYYLAMADCPIASVVKPGDRGHNQSTMGGVFSFKKQHSYILTTETRIFPMMKLARRRFVDQESAYENLHFLLRNQCRQTRVMLDALGFNPETGEINFNGTPDVVHPLAIT